MALERLHLELLQALADHPTLRSAAASINLSPSAASRRLDEAERRVGVTLTRTDGRSLELTPAGRYLAEAARVADRTLEDAEIAARWLDRGAAQPVRVGLGFHDTITWALDPTTPFEVLRTTETRWAASIERGTVDLVIDVGEVASHLDRRPLLEDRLVAVVPRDHPLAAATNVDGPDLAPLPYFASAIEPRAGFEFEQLFRPSRTSPTNIVRIESAGLILDLIAGGHGVSIQPALTVARRDDIASVELARPLPVQWYAHVNSSPNPETERLVDHIREAVARAADSVPR